jgi:hypothetical protein
MKLRSAERERMESFSLKGGANIGAINATWPMATLEVSDRSLVLKVRLVGEYRFPREDVVSLEPHGFVPVIGKGIRIVHCNPEYSGKIVFWSTEKPELLLQRIRDAGFAASAPPERAADEANRQKNIRVAPVLLLIALSMLVSALFAALGS